MTTNGNERETIPRTIGYVAMWTDRPATLRDFFVDTLHYEVAYEDESVIVFDLEGETDLIIQRVDEQTRALNGTTQFGFYVDDVGALSSGLRGRGAVLSQEMLALGDGQFLSILQAPTDHAIELVGSSGALGGEDEWENGAG